MSTTTTNKAYVKQAHNEDIDSWDAPLNANFDIIDKNLGGYLTVPHSGGTVTLSASDAQNLMFSVTGVLGSNATLVYPAIGGIFSVANNTTGNFTLTVSCAGGGGTVAVPQGQSAMILSTGLGLYSPNPLVSPTMLTTGAPSWDGSGNLTLFTGGWLKISSPTPTIWMNDTAGAGAVQRGIYADGGLIGFLKSDSNWASYTDNSGNFVAAGNVTAFSDERTKTDLTPIKDAMAIVRKMAGLFYTDIASGERRLGMVAQDLEPILPEVVGRGAGGMLTVAYGNIGAVFAEALKQIDERLAALEAR